MIASSKRLHPWVQWLLEPDRLAIFGLLGLLFAFYPELFLAQAAPLTGDHLEQHYPWASLLAQSVKEFKLPFWTSLIQCGFPLVAESQVGAFYLPNLILFFLLPFQVAYSYMNLFHWFIAGWGTYAYAKHMKLGAMASFVAAVIFTFGSAYGGAFYNMTSLKAICWFPVALYFLERYLAQGQRRFLAGMAVVIGQSFVSGYLQIAALTWMMFGVYAMLRVFLFPKAPLSGARRVAIFGALIAAAATALFLALPQIYLTFQLAMMSNRTGLEEGYAYLGSLSPLVLGTLLNPHWLMLSSGCSFYAGYLTLFLVLVSSFSPDVRKSQFFRIWGVLGALALLLAFGRWSPLYVAFVKLTRFYSFRVPAKFLVFFCFGFAMLGGMGFQVLWQGRLTQAIMRRAFRALLAILTIYAAAMIFANGLLTFGRDMVLKLGEAYVMRFVYAQPGHPHSLESYLANMKAYPDHILKVLSWDDPTNISAAIMALFCVIFVWILLRKKVIKRSLLCVGVLFLVVDLYVAAFQDMKQDLASYKTALMASPVVKILEQEMAAGRLSRIYGFRSPDQGLPLVPSKNMLHGIADMGVYSPLVTSRYYQTIGLFGNINDSTLAFTPTPAFIRYHLPLLSFMDVSHIVAAVPLNQPDLTLLYADPSGIVFLYRNERSHAKAYFIRDAKLCANWDDLKRDLMASDFDPAKQLLIEKSEYPKFELNNAKTSMLPALGDAQISLASTAGDVEIWSISAPANGFFVIPRTYYPGWHAWVDGKEMPVLKAYGLFQAVVIDTAGHHSVRFEFHPMAKVRRS